jgi:hypothetical protein
MSTETSNRVALIHIYGGVYVYRWGIMSWEIKITLIVVRPVRSNNFPFHYIFSCFVFFLCVTKYPNMNKFYLIERDSIKNWSSA